MKHSVRKGCPDQFEFHDLILPTGVKFNNSFMPLASKLIDGLDKFLRWQLSLYNESTPSLAPVTRELVMDKLGSSVRASDKIWFTYEQKYISLSEEPFVEDDHIEGGGGVGDEVTEHVHLCNKIFHLVLT